MNRYWIGVILLIFMVVAFVLRALPTLFIKDPGFLYIYDTDSWYNLRQIEVMVNNFPQYNWFDPMTAFPTGKIIDWGPLFPFIAASLCLLTGATTQSAIVFVSGWVSPLMAVVMVPVMYYFGKTIRDWKVGIVAAGLIAVISVQYFSISSYGWVDHHVAEVLFSTLFLLSYVYTKSYLKHHPVNWRAHSTLIFPVALSVLSGVIYFLGLLTSTTVILMLIVIAVFTFVEFVLDSVSGHPADDLLILNLVFLSVSTILLFVFGFKQPGVSLTQYSIGLVYVNGALITGTVLLYAFLRIFSGKRWLYLGSIAVLAVVGFFLSQIIPPLQTVTSQGMGLLFGSSTYAVSIVETLPWTLSGAWDQFNIALILMAGGLLILCYSVVKKRDDASVFLLVWSVVILLLTIHFQRFIYYFTVNVALLAAICVVEPVRWREDRVVHHLSRVFTGYFLRAPAPVATYDDITTKAPTKKERKKELKHSPGVPVHYTDTLKDICLIVVILLFIILCAISLTQDITYGMSTPGHQLSPDWVESLKWLGNHTPDTGVNYFQQYEARGFSYSPQAYGIMASWDAGHWITFIAQRIPITNPFQDHLNGPSGAAAFFLVRNESQADAILTKNGGQYVITDSTMAVDSFTNLVPWESGSTDISPYIKWFVVPDQNNPSQLQKVHLFDDAYFQTMVVRLQNFDGSMKRPTTVEYVQYAIRYVPAPGESSGDVNGYARVIASDEERDVARIPNDTVLVSEGKDITTGRFTDLFSDLPNRTIQEIPALKHYRLIHESPNNASVQSFPESGIVTLPDIKYVKIFEYVTGAHISGEGIIEVPIVTNTGRSFIYWQASENGEFVVPYSTESYSFGVHANGPYHIVGTSRNISVTEDDVVKGNLIKG